MHINQILLKFKNKINNKRIKKHLFFVKIIKVYFLFISVHLYFISTIINKINKYMEFKLKITF